MNLQLEVKIADLELGGDADLPSEVRPRAKSGSSGGDYESRSSLGQLHGQAVAPQCDAYLCVHHVCVFLLLFVCFQPSISDWPQLTIAICFFLRVSMNVFQ